MKLVRDRIATVLRIIYEQLANDLQQNLSPKFVNILKTSFSFCDLFATLGDSGEPVETACERLATLVRNLIANQWDCNFVEFFRHSKLRSCDSRAIFARMNCE